METSKCGRFIVLDGIDGSGKSMQAKALACYLFDKSKEYNVLLTREPFNSDYCAEIRRLLKEGKTPYENAEKLTELFVADRKLHAGLIAKCLSAGVHVVSDRYKYSTFAYQQAQGLNLDRLIEMHASLLVPDIAIIIDIPAKVALERIKDSPKRSYYEVFEALSFQEVLRQNFLSLRKSLPNERIVIIDGNKPAVEVFESIRKEVDKLYGSCGQKKLL
ncbi:MAG: dTMP kinase [Candidatus Woesearchaeota archaeon]